MKRLTSHQRACLHDIGIDTWVPRRLPTMVPAADSEAPAAPRAAGGGEIASVGWEALEEEVRHCTRCPLHESRTQGVFGVGDRRAGLLVIGEAPGADEDRLGEPFVGRAGKLLDQMLRAISLDRRSVYITNILKSRPPRNRDPKPDEVAACEVFLRRQIELISPRVILAVGRVAAQNLLRQSQPLGRMRGRWHEYGPERTPVWVSYHPAYLLRKPEDKRKAWQDLKVIRDRLRERES